jgi:hypothetical protein
MNLPTNCHFAATQNNERCYRRTASLPVKPVDIHYYRMTTQFGPSPSQIFCP